MLRSDNHSVQLPASEKVWVDQAKARKAIAMPLNADAMLVLRRQQGTHPERVFTYQGRPVAKANTKAWRRALADAGIIDFRWHDLRHTWASWHVQNGTPLHALQELGGWSTVQMVQRYAHLSADHLAESADRLARPRTMSVTVGQGSARVAAPRRSQVVVWKAMLWWAVQGSKLRPPG